MASNLYIETKGRCLGITKKTQRKIYIYLVSGTVAVIVDKDRSEYITPATFNIPAKTYHRIEAVTDIVMALFEE